MAHKAAVLLLHLALSTTTRLASLHVVHPSWYRSFFHSGSPCCFWATYRYLSFEHPRQCCQAVVVVSLPQHVPIPCLSSPLYLCTKPVWVNNICIPAICFGLISGRFNSGSVRLSRRALSDLDTGRPEGGR